MSVLGSMLSIPGWSPVIRKGCTTLSVVIEYAGRTQSVLTSFDFLNCLLFDQIDFWSNLGRIEYLNKDWSQFGFRKFGLAILMLK